MGLTLCSSLAATPQQVGKGLLPSVTVETRGVLRPSALRKLMFNNCSIFLNEIERRLKHQEAFKHIVLVGLLGAAMELGFLSSGTACSSAGLQPFIPVILGFGFLFRRLVFGFLIATQHNNLHADSAKNSQIPLPFFSPCEALIVGAKVFVETHKSDLGGHFWRVQMQHTQLGLVIYIMVSNLLRC